MQEKWNIRKDKKGYLKIHIAVVNIKTKEILAFLEVTEMRRRMIEEKLCQG